MIHTISVVNYFRRSMYVPQYIYTINILHQHGIKKLTTNRNNGGYAND